MSVKLSVCQNTSCNSVGSAFLVRDIEELAQGECDVEECGCLGKCGKGPNIEVTIDGNPVIHTGINTWKKTFEIVTDVAEVSVSKKLKGIAQEKYQMRRNKDASSNMLQLQKLFATLGGEVQAAKTSPKLVAELLVMRSNWTLLDKPLSALADARTAASLKPAWPQALLALSASLDATHSPSEAKRYCEDALRIGTCISTAEVKRQVARLAKKAAEEENDPSKFKQLRDAMHAEGYTQSTLNEPRKELQPIPASKVFVQFGGRKKFEELAHEVHEMMFVHTATKHFFPPTMNSSRITRRNVDFLVGAFGGPKYVGPDMISTHEFLRITNEQYDIMVEMYVQALEKMRASEPITEAILKQLEGMRYAIVYRKDRPNPNARANPKFLQLHLSGKNIDERRSATSTPAASKRGKAASQKTVRPASVPGGTAPATLDPTAASKHPVKPDDPSVPPQALVSNEQFLEDLEVPPEDYSHIRQPFVPASTCPYLAILSIKPGGFETHTLNDSPPMTVPLSHPLVGFLHPQKDA